MRKEDGHMSKLHLVIADKDEAYVEGIVNYIVNNYGKRFKVNSFTKEEYLLNYFSENKKHIDILLICPEWYKKSIHMDRVVIPIILSGGILTDKIKDCEVINKYQRGDRLVSSIINCFVEASPNRYYVTDSNKKTKIIAVYSPAGGVGKTSVAVGTSMKYAEKGSLIFYLNLEDIQSTAHFFNCDDSKNLSHILYHIKERKKNIALKIEGIRSIDSEYKIHYFLPPDSVFDLNETSSDEIEYLIEQLRIWDNYDVVFVDMSTNMDEKNISILKASDQILLVFSQEELSRVKVDSFIEELNILSKRNNLDLIDKLTIVENKYMPNRISKIEELNNKSTAVKIPVVEEPIVIYKDSYKKEMKREFRDALDKLLEVIDVNIKS